MLKVLTEVISFLCDLSTWRKRCNEGHLSTLPPHVNSLEHNNKWHEFTDSGINVSTLLAKQNPPSDLNAASPALNDQEHAESSSIVTDSLTPGKLTETNLLLGILAAHSSHITAGSSTLSPRTFHKQNQEDVGIFGNKVVKSSLKYSTRFLHGLYPTMLSWQQEAR